MSNALVPFSDMQQMAQAIAQSGLFGMKTAQQALALMLVAQSEGRHPASAAREYDIIQGRPAKKSEIMLRDFLDAGGKVEWHEVTDEKVSASFMHPSGSNGKFVPFEWDIARAKRAGLTGKDNWTKYPRAMLANRVISEGVRRIYPAATSGMYEPGEVRAIVREEKDMGRAEVVDPDTGEVQQATPQQPASSLDSGDQAGSPIPSPAAAGAPDETRDQTLTRLCKLANVNKIQKLAKANARHADELSDSDYMELVGFLQGRINALADRLQP